MNPRATRAMQFVDSITDVAKQFSCGICESLNKDEIEKCKTCVKYVGLCCSVHYDGHNACPVCDEQLQPTKKTKIFNQSVADFDVTQIRNEIETRQATLDMLNCDFVERKEIRMVYDDKLQRFGNVVKNKVKDFFLSATIDRATSKMSLAVTFPRGVLREWNFQLLVLKVVDVDVRPEVLHYKFTKGDKSLEKEFSIPVLPENQDAVGMMMFYSID